MLRVGDVIVLVKGMKVYADVQERFVYSNTPNSRNITHALISIGQFPRYCPGDYIVVHTRNDGGAVGVGMNGHDDWPDGHHVFCQKLNGYNEADPETCVDFYETGCFTAVIEGLKPQKRTE